MERQRYEMTEEDLKRIIKACQPVPAIMLQCGMPTSQQEHANMAWCELGDRMGFDGMTVEPTSGGDRCFTAIPKAIQAETAKPLTQENENA